METTGTALHAFLAAGGEIDYREPAPVDEDMEALIGGEIMEGLEG